MSNRSILKIIFNITGRTSYLYRYFKLLKNYELNFDILIINDNKNNFLQSRLEKIKTKIIVKDSTTKIIGMNSLFRLMDSFKDITLKYEYVCFVEDDNFIYPNAIDKCGDFLNSNKDYIGCNGQSFLFGKNNKFEFLNKYSAPSFKSTNIIGRVKQYENNPGLIYYSLIRSKIFTNICNEITFIKDDNLSEIFFNYLFLVKGSLKTLNQIYLAREYPRPLIYNIPALNKWTKNNKLVYDINMTMMRLIKNIKIQEINADYDLFLKLTIFKYIANRINPPLIHSQNIFLKSFVKKLYIIYFKRKFEIKKFLDKINYI